MAVNDTAFNLLFPVIPAADDPNPPDILALQNVDDLTAFAQDGVQNDGADPGSVPLTGYKSVAYDWDADELWLGETGAPLVVDDEETIIEWVNLVANTARGEYPVFSAAFGNGLLDLVGAGLPDAALDSEIARRVEEALSPLPVITQVTVESQQRQPAIDPTAVFVVVTIGNVFSDVGVQANLRM